ncbi:MAG: hypothetical protein IT379_33280 [Deltaproteobacteria bacterium]|nr:hypothetical protein [Deltaproteobacteria bacterium]
MSWLSRVPSIGHAPRDGHGDSAHLLDRWVAPRALPLVVVVLLGLATLGLHLRYARPGGAHMRGLGPSELVRDEGTVLYDAYRITRGEVMYRDFFEFQTPVFYATYALLFAVTGPSLPAARALAAVFTTLATLLLADAVSRRAGAIAGVSAGAFHVLVIVPMWPVAYPHWQAELFAFAAVWLLLARAPSPRRAVALGALAALCALTIQSLGLPLLLALVLGETADRVAREGRWRGLVGGVHVLAGAAVVTVPVLVYFAIHGALDDLLYCTWTWPLAHYAAGNQDAAQYAAYLDDLVAAHARLGPGLWQIAELCLRLVAVLPVVALALGAVAFAWVLWRLARGAVGPSDAVALGVCTAGVVSLFSGKARPDITHLAFQASFGLIALAIVVGRGRRLWATCALGLFLAEVAFGAALVHATKAGSVRQAEAPLTFRDALRRNADQYWCLRGGILDRIERDVPRDSPIVVGCLEGYVYLLFRPAAVPHTALPFHDGDNYLEPPQWRRVADGILRERPLVVSVMPYQWAQMTLAQPELREQRGATGFRSLPRASD